jgi:hypothetical protein
MLQRIMKTPFGDVAEGCGLVVAKPHHRKWAGVSRRGWGRR